MNSLEAFMLIFMSCCFAGLVVGALLNADADHEERPRHRDYWEGDD